MMISYAFITPTIANILSYILPQTPASTIVCQYVVIDITTHSVSISYSKPKEVLLTPDEFIHFILQDLIKWKRYSKVIQILSVCNPFNVTLIDVEQPKYDFVVYIDNEKIHNVFLYETIMNLFHLAFTSFDRPILTFFKRGKTRILASWDEDVYKVVSNKSWNSITVIRAQSELEFYSYIISFVCEDVMHKALFTNLFLMAESPLKQYVPELIPQIKNQIFSKSQPISVETYLIDYKNKQLKTETEMTEKAVELLVEKAELESKTELLKIKQELLNVESQLTIAKSTYPLDVNNIVNLSSNVEKLQKNLKIIEKLRTELRFD